MLAKGDFEFDFDLLVLVEVREEGEISLIVEIENSRIWDFPLLQFGDDQGFQPEGELK